MTLTNSLGWALLHFLWQGAAAAILLKFLLAVLPARWSQGRYLVSVATMLAMPILVIITMLRGSDPPPRRTSGSSASSIGNSRQPTPHMLDFESAGASIGTVATEQADEPPLAPTVREWVAQRVSTMVLLWYAGVLLFGLRLSMGWLGARALTRRDLVETPPSWTATAAALATRLGVRRSVRVVLSTRSRVPMVIGWLTPIIVAPAAALSGLTPSQVQLLLAHELVHIRRHDYLVNVLQCVIEVMLFYHPVVWWMSRTIREEREHCCDDVVVSLGGDALTYAEALLAMEQLRLNTAPRLGLAATGGTLVTRIRRLVEPNTERRSLPVWRTGVLAAGAATLLVIGGQWSSGTSTTVSKDATSTLADSLNRRSSIDRFDPRGETDNLAGQPPDRRASSAESKQPAKGVDAVLMTISRINDTVHEPAARQSDSPLPLLRWVIDTVQKLRAAGQTIEAGQWRTNAQDPVVALHYARPAVTGVVRVINKIDDLQGEWTMDGQFVANPLLSKARTALDSILGSLYYADLGPSLDAMKVAYELIESFLNSKTVPIDQIAGKRDSLSAEQAAEVIENLRKAVMYPSDWETSARVHAIKRLGELGRRAATNQWDLPTGRQFGRPSVRIVEFLSEVAGRKSEDAETQKAAIEALANIGSTMSFEALTDLAEHHPRVWVRAHTITAIATADRLYDAIPFLSKLINEESSRLVQTTILGVLANRIHQSETTYGDPEAGFGGVIPQFARGTQAYDTLKDLAKNHPDPELRKLAEAFLSE